MRHTFTIDRKSNMNLKHQAWWTMLRHIHIWEEGRLLKIRYTNPRPILVNFASWLAEHFWYILHRPAAHLQYHHYTHIIALGDPRFVLLFAGESRNRLTDILYYVTWTLYYYSKVVYDLHSFGTTTTIFPFFGLLTDELQRCSKLDILLHFVVDREDIPGIKTH
jgi:membrane protein required for beta-lactamase induction